MADVRDSIAAVLGNVTGSSVNGGSTSTLGGVDLSALQYLVNNGVLLIQALNTLTTTLSTILPFGGGFGTFTCGAAATTTVSEPTVAANSVILLMPTNAAAGTLQGSTKSLYVSARTADTSFTVATASAAAAAGTETFAYIVVNPSG